MRRGGTDIPSDDRDEAPAGDIAEAHAPAEPLVRRRAAAIARVGRRLSEPMAEASAPGDAAGTYDLGTGNNADADTCEQCISALAGTAAAPSVFYFQHEGQLDVTLITFATVTATFTGVQLAEVDGSGAVVAGGTCLRIADGTIEVEP